MNRPAVTKQLLQINLIGAVYCAAVAIVAYFVAIAPSASRRDEHLRQQAEIADLRNKLDQTSKFQKQLGAQLAARQGDLERSAVQLEPASSVNSRVSSLTQLASSTGIALDAVEPGTQDDASDFTMVPIRLSGKGNYAASARFLAALKQQFPDTAVGSMRLNGNPADPGVPPSVWFDLVWYAAPEGKKQMTSVPVK